jgi:hypothetical protein
MIVCGLSVARLCPPQAIQLVPALPTRLLPMLVQNIPHKLRDRSSQCLFLRAVILLAEGKVRSAGYHVRCWLSGLVAVGQSNASSCAPSFCWQRERCAAGRVACNWLCCFVQAVPCFKCCHRMACCHIMAC